MRSERDADLIDDTSIYFRRAGQREKGNISGNSYVRRRYFVCARITNDEQMDDRKRLDS